MTQELFVPVSKESIKTMLNEIGVSEKRIDAMGFEITETPLEGVFGKLAPATFETVDKDGNPITNKYGVIEIYDVNDKSKKIGTMSIARLFDSAVVKDSEGQIVLRKLGEQYASADAYAKSAKGRKASNYGKYMLKTAKVSNLSHLGKSELEQLGQVFGKTYKATRVPCFVPKSFDPAIIVNENKHVVSENVAPKDLLTIAVM